MRLLLKAWSANEYDDGGCEFALVNLTSELARLALRRIQVLKDQKAADPDVGETYYWNCCAVYFSRWVNLNSLQTGVPSARDAMNDLLDRLQVDKRERVAAPEDFEVEESSIARTECEQMIVHDDEITFLAIPKHTGFYVTTAAIPLVVLEAAVTAASASANVR